MRGIGKVRHMGVGAVADHQRDATIGQGGRGKNQKTRCSKNSPPSASMHSLFQVHDVKAQR